MQALLIRLRLAGVLSMCVLLRMSAAAAGGPQAPPPAATLASRIQAHYDAVRDLQADFTLTQSTSLSRRVTTDRGHVAIRKPGRMHWTFLTGNKSEVVADGVRIYSYFPQDKLVQIAPYPDEGEASMALLFVAGRGNLTRDFRLSLPADQPAGAWALQLAPRTAQADFVSITLVVDPASMQWRSFTILDDQGGTRTFRFTNLRENAGTPDALFEFRIPKGVEIRR
jgi:outer membrane lipoprotein carrier protein